MHEAWYGALNAIGTFDPAVMRASYIERLTEIDLPYGLRFLIRPCFQAHLPDQGKVVYLYVMRKHRCMICKMMKFVESRRDET